MKYINEKYIRNMQKALRLRKFHTIEEYRKYVSRVDAQDPMGVCKDLPNRLHIYGNTATTYVEMIQKKSISEIYDKTKDDEQKENPLDKQDEDGSSGYTNNNKDVKKKRAKNSLFNSGF